MADEHLRVPLRQQDVRINSFINGALDGQFLERCMQSVMMEMGKHLDGSASMGLGAAGNVVRLHRLMGTVLKVKIFLISGTHTHTQAATAAHLQEEAAVAGAPVALLCEESALLGPLLVLASVMGSAQPPQWLCMLRTGLERGQHGLVIALCVTHAGAGSSGFQMQKAREQEEKAVSRLKKGWDREQVWMLNTGWQDRPAGVVTALWAIRAVAKQELT
eukprot:1159825-Pelagomonas_calceolata.AAC.5